MTLTTTTRLIATCFALAAFSVAIIAGLAADNPGTTVLTTAIICMIGCQLIGLVVGAVAQRAIDEHLSRYRAKNPIPKEEPIDVYPVGETPVEGEQELSHAA